jgi:hypothetical protein
MFVCYDKTDCLAILIEAISGKEIPTADRAARKGHIPA